MSEQLNILVVDDEPGIRITLTEILEDEGYNVIAAADGYKGIAAAQKKNFEIAFIDMRMPGINGIETFKEIKRISPGTTVFLMTAFLAEETLNEMVGLEIQAILDKPLDLDVILKTLKEDLTKTTILVVDDECSFRETLKEVLGKNGYSAYVAEDGLTAIKMAKETHFDIVFIDVMLPGINGFQTLEKIKEIDPATNVIMMTDQNIDDFIEPAVSRGAFAHLTKPVDLVKLLQLTINAIENR
ncbi:response regulator receiver protein [Candidatus Scalindua japonica]|uniref:Response regulator receiver protein n=1 Tax=Candidatus Scalindua japonica TaxID=1284222 RepID=A0A286U245_9BACT|nr:response regulator [Candidatus Scalindua japonica]GAX62131.1 response regulator receiver protein [Candidatus Scalindua japonica]